MVLKTVKAPLTQVIGKVVDVLADKQARQATKHVELPQTQCSDKVDVPAVMQRQASGSDCAGDGGSPAGTPVPLFAEPAKNPRSSRRYLRERPDASDDDTPVLPRNSHLPPPCEGPRPPVEPVPPSFEPEEDSDSAEETC